MATLKNIRKRIVSVRNTQKITKAMKMVAAAKLRRAQNAVVQIRPYAERLRSILSAVDKKSSTASHPFFELRDAPKKICVVVFSSNRGLCGGFNSNLLRRTETFIREALSHQSELRLYVIGRKGRDFFRARKREIDEVFVDYADGMGFETCSDLAQRLLKEHSEGLFDVLYVAFNRFKSALSLEVTIHELIPFLKESTDNDKRSGAPHILVDFIFEPSKGEFLDKVIPWHVAAQILRAHRESQASELGSRMSAMENATNNASEMIRILTMQFNRLRQQAITTELMDIVNGAEAIK